MPPIRVFISFRFGTYRYIYSRAVLQFGDSCNCLESSAIRYSIPLTLETNRGTYCTSCSNTFDNFGYVRIQLSTQKIIEYI